MSEATPGQAARAVFLAEADRTTADWMPATPWEKLPPWLRGKWEAIAQAAIDASAYVSQLEHDTAASAQLLDEIGVLAANAPEDGDSFAVLEEITMRIAAHGIPDESAAATAQPAPATSDVELTDVTDVLIADGNVVTISESTAPAPELAAAMAETRRVRDLLDDFTHAVIDLRQSVKLADTAAAVRKKAGLPEITQ